MSKKIILSQKQKTRKNYEKYFAKGLSIAGAILLSLKEGGESFLEGLPDYYGAGIYKKFFGVGKYKRQNIKKQTLNINLYRLQQQGLIVKDPKEKIFVLTAEGKKLLLEVENRFLIFQKPWDKKLRLVFFDIPETQKIWRQWLRKELSLLGFVQIQESVYAGKYPLPQSFYEEINSLGIDKYIFVITAQEIDKEDEIIQLLNKK
jgi:DNA-binding PadR family transcriptional regulator